MAIRTYRAKPVEVQAVQYVGGKDNVHEIQQWMRESYGWGDGTHVFITKGMAQGAQAWSYIKDGKTWDSKAVAAVYDAEIHMAWLPVQLGQFIVKGPKGEFYPCDDEVFDQKYEPTEEQTS